ncbi:MAG TPA: serine/threonine-protein kinase [Anaeromyxobacteraceae bacterium]|nr:serine/threonine-protein kinase [Anaeromyxobacteraceae bacterium]
MSARALAPGATLGGRYELLREMGSGGMGTVFEAVQRALDRRVAVKVLHPHVAALPGAAERFRREAMLLARLRHPNTVEVYDWGEDEGRLFLAMEMLRGEPLDALMVREAPLPTPRIVALVAQVLDLLEAAHALGIVHRDVKPSNVMVCAEPGSERAKVLDLGLAIVMGDAGMARLTESGLLQGTPAYMAPEQCRAQAVDGRTDLYALGCVLYEMLVGQPPFGISPPMEVMAGHVFRPVRPPSEVRPDRLLSSELERIVLQSLAKRPADRPQGAARMREALLSAARRPFGEAPARAGARSERSPPTIEIEGAAAAPPGGLPAVGVLALAADGSENPDADQGVITALRASGFAARRTGPGGAAVEPGEVVLVVSPPGSSHGLTVARSLAAQPGAGPVLLCGPEDDIALVTSSIDAGVFDYVPLPLDPADLARKVTR